MDKCDYKAESYLESEEEFKFSTTQQFKEDECMNLELKEDFVNVEDAQSEIKQEEITIKDECSFNNEQKLTPEIETFDCTNCDYKTKNNNLLKNHMLIHQTNIPTSDWTNLPPLVAIQKKNSNKSATSKSAVQTILNLKMKNKLTTAEKLKFKRNGPPKPSMSIKYTSQNKGKEGRRYFRESMYDMADWICGCDTQNAFFCFPCLLFDKDSTWSKVGVTDLKNLRMKVHKHSLSTSHMNNCCNLATLGKNVDIKKQFDSQNGKKLKLHNENVARNKYILNKLIDCMLFCGAFELGLIKNNKSESPDDDPGIFEGLINLVSELDPIFKDHLQKSDVFKGTLRKTIKNELLDAISAVAHQQIKSEIDRSDFVAIQADVTTDTSNNAQLLVIFRYVSNGVIRERFWKLIQLKDTTTQNLTDVITKELEFLKSPEKLIGQSYVGASVIGEAIGGVPTKIKKKYPSAHFVHSYAYELNYVLQKVASNYSRDIKIFFAKLHAFTSFFESPGRTALLDEVFKSQQPDKQEQTLWNFTSKYILETIYEYKTQLLDCMEKIVDLETQIDAINHAIGLKNYLQDEDFLYWLHFFYLLTPPCDQLSNQLQRRCIYVTTLKQCIDDFNRNVVKIRDFLKKPFGESPNHQSAKRTRESSKNETMIKVCDVIMSEITQRFESSNYLILSQLFHADRFFDFKKIFPREIFQLVKTEYPTIINFWKFKTELEVLYNRDDFCKSESPLVMLQFFTKNNLCNTFSESDKFLKILCTLPLAAVESAPSTLKRTKMFLKNTIAQEKLCALAMLSLEKSFIKNIKDFNEKVLEHFAAQNDRARDFREQALK